MSEEQHPRESFETRQGMGGGGWGPTDFLARQEGGYQTQRAANLGWNQVVRDSPADFSLQRLRGWVG